jgi:hypothetical protein
MQMSDIASMRKFLVLAGFLTSLSLPALGQTELIQDGDFESPIFTAWSISTGAGIKNTPQGAAHGGANYLSLGNNSLQVQLVYQTITIPSNAVSAKLTFYVNVVTAVPSVSTDELDVALTRAGGGTVITFIDTELGSNPDPGLGSANYRKIVFDLTPYAGQTMNLAFQATMGTFGTGTAFNIDDVSVILEMPWDVPPNDYFTNRTVITNNSAVKFGTNFFATKESGEPNHANNQGGKSLWWRWTAPTNGVLQLNTVGSSFVSLLAAYTGDSVTNLSKLAANNGNNNGDGYARINFAVAAQTEVQIAVDGFNNIGGAANAQSGAVVLNLNFKPDTTKPTVAISSPAAGAKVPTNAVTVLGTASDNLAVALVQFRLENSAGTNDYQDAIGTNKWTAIVTNLIPGPNTVRVRAYDTSSNLSLTVARMFNYVLTSPLDLSTTGNGYVSPNYSNSLLEIGATYTLTATPRTGSLFSNWTGTITATAPKLVFTMQTNMVLQANFVTNPFTPVKGNYAGLFFDTNMVTITNAGFFSAALATAGTFSSKWQFANVSYSKSGAFSLLGTYSNAIPRTGKSPLLVQLQLDLAGGETITGTISDGVWTAQVAANRAHFSTTNPAPQKGSYTFVIPGSDDPSTRPGGNGVGTVKVSTTGGIAFAGALGDGTAVSRSAYISKDGAWPLFAPLYSGKGLLIGWINFDTNQPATDLGGIVNWIKLPQAVKYYPAGFDFPEGLEAVGSLYKLTNGVPLVNWTDGQIILEGGNLADSITNAVTISADNKITGTNKLSLTFTLTTGLFQGNVVNPTTGKSIAIKGALLQKQSLGYGYFLGTNQTGSVFLGPQ